MTDTTAGKRSWGDGHGRVARPKPIVALARIPFLKQALALAVEAGDIDALKDVAAMATALQKGAQARGMGIGAENQAAEVVLRAERAIGAALDLMTEAGLRRGRGSNQHHSEGDDPPGLPELGISMKQAHLFRRLGDLPNDEFEALLTAAHESGKRIAKVNFYSTNKPDEFQREARNVVLEAWHSEDDPAAFVAWGKATRALIDGDLMPADVLTRVAPLIRELVDWYTERRAALA